MKIILPKLLAGGLFILPLIAVAANGGSVPQPPGWGEINVLVVLDNITNALFMILLVVAVIFFIIAGYHFIVSQGDPAKFDTAKKMILYGAIGVLVAFLAKGIVLLINEIVRS